MKKLTTVNSRLEAEEMIALLDSCQIAGMTKSVGAGGFFNVAFNISTAGEDIYVNEEDFEQALKVIESMQPSGPDDVELEPQIRKLKRKRRILAVAVLLFLGAYFLYAAFIDFF